MAQVKITIPGLGDDVGETPIVILGPNGSGKTQLAQKIATNNEVSAISAQRRTWLDDQIPVEAEDRLRKHVRNQQSQWQSRSWQPTEEINHILSTLIQEHTNQLTKRNEEAIAKNTAVEPLRDTKLIQLQGLWSKLYPTRKLEI